MIIGVTENLYTNLFTSGYYCLLFTLLPVPLCVCATSIEENIACLFILLMCSVSWYYL